MNKENLKTTAKLVGCLTYEFGFLFGAMKTQNILIQNGMEKYVSVPFYVFLFSPFYILFFTALKETINKKK